MTDALYELKLSYKIEGQVQSKIDHVAANDSLHAWRRSVPILQELTKDLHGADTATFKTDIRKTSYEEAEKLFAHQDDKEIIA